MLDIALHTCLRGIFHKHGGATQHIWVQFGLAGAVTTHRIDVHAGLHHVGRDDGGLGLVGRDSGHDIGTTHGLCHAGAYTHRHGQIAQVGKQFAGGLPVRIEKTQFGDAQQVVESQGLEFALRAVADQRHAAAARAGQCARCHGRHGGSSQCGGEGEFRQQQGHSRGHVGQHTKGHHGR